MATANRLTRHARIVLALCATAVEVGCAMGSPASQGLAAGHGVPNFHIVDSGVYRGGQPTSEGWAYLKSLGVKTVVKLDLPAEGTDEEAARLGMTVVDASGPPSDLKNFYEAPDPARIRLAVQTLEDESRWPIYVHCLHGQDRTGLIVGLFRVRHDHYTKPQAFAEMRENNFHWALFPGLVDVWEDFDGKTLP
ncbi:tyrosine-protein phosphatase [Crenobacter sp. SG2305]|uniref:fused DSP-PTPase phosphatase/NAD kinase-like protein n=1 Tax=Crenobacter oryzisoli TaxID=3056844 RepID=UPI0025AB3286|nr:tyrosine-protein phosphatase [Crenobacter sp. SG2305]MDN0082742.1 tyrosine-protein phosphatase [Crenobacter sp. SG2305]